MKNVTQKIKLLLSRRLKGVAHSRREGRLQRLNYSAYVCRGEFLKLS
jgi:hypothetical protein